MARTIRDGRVEHVIEYQPLESQWRFHALGSRYKGFSGPIGSGKSAALCQEAIRMAYINAGCVGLVGAPTYPMLRDSTQRALTETLETQRLPFRMHKSDGYIELTDCRSKILMRSLDEYERLRGTNLAWFGVDELTYCREEAWLRLAGRLREPAAKRHCGFAVWTPKGKDWVQRRFLLNPAKDYRVVVAKPAENKHILNVDPEFYERLKETYSDAFYRQEVLGEYLVTAGNRVYAPFEEGVHVKAQQLDVNSPLLWALDFNVSPFCTVICQRRGDELAVIDELVLARGTTVEMVDDMNERYGGRGLSLVVYGDASGNAGQTNGPSNYKQIQAVLETGRWRSILLKNPKSNPPVLDRIHLVNRMLRSADDEVHLTIDEKCKSLIADLKEVQFAEDGIHIDKTSDSQRTHSADALGYLIWEEFSARQTIGERRAKGGSPIMF